MNTTEVLAVRCHGIKSLSLAAAALFLLASPARAVEWKAGNLEMNLGLGIRVGLYHDDQGLARTKNSDPAAKEELELERSDFKIGIEASKKLRFDALVELHKLQRDASDTAVELAYFTYEVVPDYVSIMVGQQGLNAAGVENTYDVIDVPFYSTWYDKYGGGADGLYNTPGIVVQGTFGPVVASFQASDRKTEDSGQAAKETNPMAIMGRIDYNLKLGKHQKITPLVEVVALSNSEKQYCAGILATLGDFTGDVGYNRTLLTKTNAEASTNESGEKVARTIWSPEVMLRYRFQVSKDHSLTPYVKWAALYDDRKDLGQKPDALQTTDSDLFIGMGHTADGVTEMFSVARRSGTYYEDDDAARPGERRSGIQYVLHLMAQI